MTRCCPNGVHASHQTSTSTDDRAGKAKAWLCLDHPSRTRRLHDQDYRFLLRLVISLTIFVTIIYDLVTTATTTLFAFLGEYSITILITTTVECQLECFSWVFIPFHVTKRVSITCLVQFDHSMHGDQQNASDSSTAGTIMSQGRSRTPLNHARTSPSKSTLKPHGHGVSSQQPTDETTSFNPGLLTPPSSQILDDDDDGAMSIKISKKANKTPVRY